MKPTLLMGYGNADRGDDGVAWHILCNVATLLGRDLPAVEVGFFPDGNDPDFMFALQLVPEYSEILSHYSRVCFIDAHTGAINDDLNMIKIDPGFQSSPFTHHLTPMTCLSLCQTIYGTVPEAIMVSVRGYDFGFTCELSQKTSGLAKEAGIRILAWLANTY
jgi:Ni,Fe-hydrogenase maturation factor